MNKNMRYFNGNAVLVPDFEPQKDEEYEKLKKERIAAKEKIKANNIKLDIFIKKNPTLIGYKNEYSQVLINIINNAKDVLIQRKIKDPYIKISIYEEKENIITSIEDNAGGIKIEPLEKIFEPFFTYQKLNGSGLGLFMSKLIIENNMHGKLLVENSLNGAIFRIIIPNNQI